LRQRFPQVLTVENCFHRRPCERRAFETGFRSGEIVQKTIDAALGRHRYPCSKDIDREVIWPRGASVEKIAYRGTIGRTHIDIPLHELAGLADVLRARSLFRSD
jgi:hypothetical protein